MGQLTLQNSHGLKPLLECVQQPAMKLRIKDAGMYELPPEERVDSLCFLKACPFSRRRAETA
jgi:hypothetical protein